MCSLFLFSYSSSSSSSVLSEEGENKLANCGPYVQHFPYSPIYLLSRSERNQGHYFSKINWDFESCAVFFFDGCDKFSIGASHPVWIYRLAIFGIQMASNVGPTVFTIRPLYLCLNLRGMHIGSFRRYLEKVKKGEKEKEGQYLRPPACLLLLVLLSPFSLNFSIFEFARRRDFPLKKEKRK